MTAVHATAPAPVARVQRRLDCLLQACVRCLVARAGPRRADRSAAAGWHRPARTRGPASARASVAVAAQHAIAGGSVDALAEAQQQRILGDRLRNWIGVASHLSVPVRPSCSCSASTRVGQRGGAVGRAAPLPQTGPGQASSPVTRATTCTCNWRTILPSAPRLSLSQGARRAAPGCSGALRATAGPGRARRGRRSRPAPAWRGTSSSQAKRRRSSAAPRTARVSPRATESAASRVSRTKGVVMRRFQCVFEERQRALPGQSRAGRVVGVRIHVAVEGVAGADR